MPLANRSTAPKPQRLSGTAPSKCVAAASTAKWQELAAGVEGQLAIICTTNSQNCGLAAMCCWRSIANALRALASQRGPETLCKPGPEVAGVFCAAGQVDFARKKAEARPRSVN
jgi:hypothetical protein